MADEDRLYTVTGQRQANDFSSEGEVTKGIKVTWVARGNIHGDLFIPLNEFTAERVDTLIRERLQDHYRVAALGVD